MAANNYKIGDRVVVVQNWTRRHCDRMNHLRGSIVTIDSICERVLEHHEREKFYRFAEAYPEGHVWDDCDILGLAPMLPRPQFEIAVGLPVVLLAHDKANDFRPGIITRITSGHFVVQDKWNLQEIVFQRDNFSCVDCDQCCRFVVYRNEAVAKENQKLVRLQHQTQQMFWQYTHKVPSVKDLECVANCIIPQNNGGNYVQGKS